MPTSRVARLWFAGAILSVFAVLGAGYLLVLQPQVNALAEETQRAADADTLAGQLDMKLARLRQEYNQLPTKQAELAAIQSAMPESANLPAFMRDLESTAATSGVTLMKVSPGQPIEAAAAPAALTTTPTGAATTASTAAGAAAGAGTATGPTVVEIPVTLETMGGFHDTEVFLRSLSESLERAVLVDTVDLTAVQSPTEADAARPAMKNGDVQTRIGLRIFVMAGAQITPPDGAYATTTITPSTGSVATNALTPVPSTSPTGTAPAGATTSEAEVTN